MSIESRAMRMARREWLTKLGLASALLLLVLISFVTFNSVDQFASSSRLVSHTHLVIKQISQVVSDVKEAESAQRGYLISGNERFLNKYNDILADFPSEIAALRGLTYENIEQLNATNQLEILSDKKIGILYSGIAALEDKSLHKSEEVVALVEEEGRLMMNRLQAHARSMIAAEESLLRQRAEQVERKAQSTKLWILFGNLLAIALLLSALWLILREIEYRKATQREIEKSAAQLQLTNKELESFSYSVSHDLRSPLRAIDGYSRMFEEDFADRLDDEGRRLLGVIRTNSRKMGQLIDDLLAFSRMGRKPLEVTKVDMNALIDEVWAEVCVVAKTELPLKKTKLPDAWGDRALLRQVLMNLLSNALKYSSKKTEQIVEISAQQSAHEVVYSVRDNGVGFDMRFYNKLFGVFQRLHTESEFPGTGVGLAIAQRVVVRHGGRIWAESRLDEYTVFSFSLPKEVAA